MAMYIRRAATEVIPAIKNRPLKLSRSSLLETGSLLTGCVACQTIHLPSSSFHRYLSVLPLLLIHQTSKKNLVGRPESHKKKNKHKNEKPPVSANAILFEVMVISHTLQEFPLMIAKYQSFIRLVQ